MHYSFPSVLLIFTRYLIGKQFWRVFNFGMSYYPRKYDASKKCFTVTVCVCLVSACNVCDNYTPAMQCFRVYRITSVFDGIRLKLMYYT